MAGGRSGGQQNERAGSSTRNRVLQISLEVEIDLLHEQSGGQPTQVVGSQVAIR